jgi:site-specific recombinase XerD
MDELLVTDSEARVVSGSDERAVTSSRLRLDRHPAAVYLARLSPGSHRATRHALSVLAELLSGGKADPLTLDWAALRYQHTSALRVALDERYAPATANRILSALRGVLEEAFALGLMNAEDYQRARQVRSIRAEVLPAGRALTSGEIKALLDHCVGDPSPAGIRDAAIIALLYGAGLRRSELAALALEDYQLESGALAVRSGKGRKERLVYVRGGAEQALSLWLEVRGSASGPLFVPISKAGKLEMRAMTGLAVFFILKRRASKASVREFSPHDLRRTFIGDLLDAGADIATVQRLAGHASVQTTARYDRRGEETKRRATELLHVPFSLPLPRAQVR